MFLLAITILILSMFYIERIADILISIISIQEDSYYFKGYYNTKYLELRDWEIPTGIIIMVAILLFSLVVYYNTKASFEYRVYFIAYTIGVFFLVISYKVYVFQRLSDFFYYFIIFCLPVAIDRIKEKKAVLIVLILYFSISIYGQINEKQRQLFPYQLNLNLISNKY